MRPRIDATLGLACAILVAGCHPGRLIGLQPKAAPTLVDRASPFALPSHTGARVELASALAQRDVLLVFYRGHW